MVFHTKRFGGRVRVLKTILVVDDDPLIREVMVEYLDGCGYRTLDAANGIDGLRILLTEPVHLLISDVMMPDMPGTEMALKAASMCPSLPVILISGSYTPAPEDRWLFLAKPFRLPKLLSMVWQAVPQEPRMAAD